MPCVGNSHVSCSPCPCMFAYVQSCLVLTASQMLCWQHIVIIHMLQCCACFAGDKSIFGHLGIGTYRNRVNGIPAMVQDLVDHMSNEPECRRQYMQAMVKLTELMWQPGTALKELVNPYIYSTFPDFGIHRKRLSQGLHDYLKGCHPAAVPVCSCAKAWDLAKDSPKVCQ